MCDVKIAKGSGQTVGGALCIVNVGELCRLYSSPNPVPARQKNIVLWSSAFLWTELPRDFQNKQTATKIPVEKKYATNGNLVGNLVFIKEEILC